MFNAKYKPLVMGIITLGCLDMIGLFTMIVNADLTERIIPALVGVQIIGFVAIAIVYMTRAQSQPGIGGASSGSNDSVIATEKAQTSKWTRMRWLWFAIAACGIVQTPFAVANAIHLATSYHRLAPIMVFAFAIRIGMIWLFLKLWWRLRPTNP